MLSAYAGSEINLSKLQTNHNFLYNFSIFPLPNLTHMEIRRLNMDNSWHIKFGEKSILIDPWLKGVEIDFFSWFNMQWHRTPPMSPQSIPHYDFVIITQKYPDHFHEETLLELQPDCLIVPKSIHKRVSQLLPNSQVRHHLEDVSDIIAHELNLKHLPSKRHIDPIYDAFVLDDGKESILLATHGYAEADQWKQNLQDIPPITVAFTPFNLYKLPFFLGGIVSPGIDAVKKLITDFNPKHIIATHDEDKFAKGLVSKLAKITLSPPANELVKNELFKERLLTLTSYDPITI